MSWLRHNSTNNGTSVRLAGHAYPHKLADVPANPREETERIVVIVERVLEEHAQTLEKLAND